MIHIVFQHSDVAALYKSFALDENLKGDIVEIKDEYAVGPLNNIYDEEGIERRKQWWRDVLAGGDYTGHVDTGTVDDNKTVAELADNMRENEKEVLWIWAAQNKHDVSGYYWLLPFIREFRGRVFILYLNNLPFINEKGNIFYPTNIFEIPAKEFLKAKKLAREISIGEFELDIEEWTRLCNENKGVRLLEGGKKLVQDDYDFYDKELKKFITPDWQKASKIIHHFLSKAKPATGDMYLLWRLKIMVSQNMFDVQGKIAHMKDFEVKLKAE